MSTYADDSGVLALAWTRPDPAEAPGLAEEFERLFVGPGPVPCPPYESYWREDVPPLIRHSLMGPCVDQLVGLYAEIGVQVRPSAGELPDHVAVELEAFHRAAGHPGGQSVADTLLRDHLAVWIPAFCDAVEAATDDEYYRELSAATREWVSEVLVTTRG